MWKPSSDTYCRKTSTRPTRVKLHKTQYNNTVTIPTDLLHSQAVNPPGRHSDISACHYGPTGQGGGGILLLFWGKKKKLPHSRMLTLINMLPGCAAGRDRCTGAGVESPPGKQTEPGLQKAPRSFFTSQQQSPSSQTRTPAPPSLLAHSPCVLSGSRAPAGHGASRPAE